MSDIKTTSLELLNWGAGDFLFFKMLKHTLLKSARLAYYKALLDVKSQRFLCFKAKATRVIPFIELKNNIKDNLPELKTACENSPYFTSFDNMYWFRHCPCYKNLKHRKNAELAIREAVLEEAIKLASKPSWFDKCFIW